ncbi:4'-phosphopantetheinyl transferase family protein [Streptomyces sp. NPDC048416]|uniref:4'-phosphopantetheinyl transferase family protein n=1 Tax=Streptomyces sp. NPDC048416 TaxID=3365546 RepID=UPI00371497BE
MTTTRTQTPPPRHPDPRADGTSDVRVWWWRIPSDTFSRSDLELLNAAEAENARRIKSATGAAQYVTCRAAVRRVLAEVLRVPHGEISLGRKPCPECGSAEHGPPAVLTPDAGRAIHLSLSHTGGLGMLAVSRLPVGVDVEAERDQWSPELADKVLSPRERASVLATPAPARTRAFLRCWTRKEAVLKAVGIGIVTTLSALETHPELTGPVEMTTDALGSLSAWQVMDVKVPEGWTASVALPLGTGQDISVHPV